MCVCAPHYHSKQYCPHGMLLWVDWLCALCLPSVILSTILGVFIYNFINNGIQLKKTFSDDKVKVS